jgi:hypothetical protein
MPRDSMQTAKTKIFGAIVSSIFLLQLFFLYSRPWWGPSDFPMTLVRSTTVPVVCGITAILAVVASQSSSQKRILYSIIVASTIQFITIRIMVQFQEPMLVILSLITSAFITFQFLEYGSISIARTSDRPDYPNKTASSSVTSGGAPTISGVVFRLTAVALAGWLGTYFMVGPIAFSEVGVVTVACLMLPIILFAILRWRQLRKKPASRPGEIGAE